MSAWQHISEHLARVIDRIGTLEEHEIEQAALLWRSNNSTRQIADVMRLPEYVIYNSLERIKAHAFPKNAMGMAQKSDPNEPRWMSRYVFLATHGIAFQPENTDGRDCTDEGTHQAGAADGPAHRRAAP